MKPLFTIHGGEYLVGSYIEKHYRQLNVWIPSRDSGVDLLISDHRNRRTVGLQVKFSKDFLVTHVGPAFQENIRACGWWTIDSKKVRTSRADFWVLVLLGFARRTTDFVIVPPEELWKCLQSLGRSQRKIQTYLWVTQRDRCWETRGLSMRDQLGIGEGKFRDSRRNLTKWLNNWAPLAELKT